MLTASVILDALLQKHQNDLCVPECKTGSTWFARQYCILDLWVMKKSWSKPWTIGYEIKINRTDFLNDDKWEEYMKYCCYFYFVAPQGLIHPEELPPEVGLLVASKNGTRLYTKRKAVRREIIIPESLFRYVLMWRTRITNEQYHQTLDDYWQHWLREKDEKKQLGHNVSRKIRQLVNERIDKVEKENRELQFKIKALNNVKLELERLGINNAEIYNHRLKQKIKEIETGIPDGLIMYLDRVIDDLNEVRKRINHANTI